MGNQSSSSNKFSLQELENQINLLVDWQEAKLMPNFSPLIIEEKLKYFQIIHENILHQKEKFFNNCEKINNTIDEQFRCIVNLLRDRQRTLKNKLLKEARDKIATWDSQITTCEAIMEWLRVIDVGDNKLNLSEIKNILNGKLMECFQFIDSGDVQFDFGEEKLDNSTVTLLKPLQNLGNILYNHDLKLIAPKFVIGSSGDGDGQFCRPWGACTDSLGYIYVSDRSNHRVQVFNELGEFILQFGKEGSRPGEFNRPAGIVVNKKNQVIVSDKDNHRIQIFTQSGRLIMKFGSQGTEPGKFLYPWDVAASSTCEIAVSDSKNHRIQLFNEFGLFLRIFDWRKMDLGRSRAWLRLLDSPRGLAFRQDNSLLVTDFNNHRILMIDRSFEKCKIFGCEGSEPGKFFRPQGIACDMFGRFAVADCKNYRIQIFDDRNRLIKVFGCQGKEPGRFDCPQGIAFHPNGSIVVVDFNNDRVQIF